MTQHESSFGVSLGTLMCVWSGCETLETAALALATLLKLNFTCWENIILCHLLI